MAWLRLRYFTNVISVCVHKGAKGMAVSEVSRS
jgi:hypothetical protein